MAVMLQMCARFRLPPVFSRHVLSFHRSRVVPIAALACGLTLAASGAAYAGPPFLTDDPMPVDDGHWEVYGFSAGALRASDSSGLGPSVEVNYGIAPESQVHVVGTSAFDHPAGQHAQFGVGDTEMGIKYRLLNPGAGSWLPQIGVFPMVELPSGNARRGLGAGHLLEFLPVWAKKDFGKWTLCAGGGYWISPGAGNRNSWFGGVLLQRQVTEQLSLGAEIFYQTSLIPGRNGTSGFNVGSVYDITEHYHVLLSAGRGGLAYAIDAAAESKPFTYYAALQWTF